jgi:hypothetical protein
MFMLRDHILALYNAAHYKEGKVTPTLWRAHYTSQHNLTARVMASLWGWAVEECMAWSQLCKFCTWTQANLWIIKIRSCCIKRGIYVQIVYNQNCINQTLFTLLGRPRRKWENINVDHRRKILWECEMDWPGSASCPVMILGIKSFEPPCSVTTELV